MVPSDRKETINLFILGKLKEDNKIFWWVYFVKDPLNLQKLSFNFLLEFTTEKSGTDSCF